jgi:hypothetical protein
VLEPTLTVRARSVLTPLVDFNGVSITGLVFNSSIDSNDAETPTCFTLGLIGFGGSGGGSIAAVVLPKSR